MSYVTVNHRLRSLGLSFVTCGLALGCVSGCGSPSPVNPAHQGQSFATAMQLICGVDQSLGLSAEDNPITIDMERYDWFMSHIKNPDAIELVTLLRVRSDSEKARMLDSALERTPHKKCALSETLRSGS